MNEEKSVTKKSFIELHKKASERNRVKSEKYGAIGNMAISSFKKVTLGTADNPQSLFILGFMAGYLKKEKEIISKKTQ